MPRITGIPQMIRIDDSDESRGKMDMIINTAPFGSVICVGLKEPVTSLEFDLVSRRIGEWCQAHGHEMMIFGDRFEVVIKPPDKKIRYIVTEDSDYLCGDCGESATWDDSGLWCYECQKYLIEHGDAAIGEASRFEAGR